MIHQQRVIFGDTDQMGVVYYANYYRYFEASRAAFLRSLGRNQDDLERWEVALPVVESYCRHRLPARYEDLLDVEVTIERVRGASLRFAYRVTRGDDLIAEGYTVHACVHTGTGAPRRMPDEFRALIESRPAG